MEDGGNASLRDDQGSTMYHIQHRRRPPDIPQLLTVLQTHQVRYVLIGSVAAQVHGVDVGMPGDLDVTPALDIANMQRLAAMLRDIDAVLDIDEPAGHWNTQPDGERTWITDELTSEIIAARAAWFANPHNISTVDHLFLSQHGNFDVVPELAGTYEVLMQRAIAAQAFGHTVWVAYIDDLLATLTIPRRAKDAPRVQQLRALQQRHIS